MVTGVANTRVRPFYRPKKTFSVGREVESFEAVRDDQADTETAQGKQVPKRDAKRGRKLDISL